MKTGTISIYAPYSWKLQMAVLISHLQTHIAEWGASRGVTMEPGWDEDWLDEGANYTLTFNYPEEQSDALRALLYDTVSAQRWLDENGEYDLTSI